MTNYSRPKKEHQNMFQAREWKGLSMIIEDERIFFQSINFAALLKILLWKFLRLRIPSVVSSRFPRTLYDDLWWRMKRASHFHTSLPSNIKKRRSRTSPKRHHEKQEQKNSKKKTRWWRMWEIVSGLDRISAVINFSNFSHDFVARTLAILFIFSSRLNLSDLKVSFSYP